MYTPVAVSIGLTYSYLPFMVLPIYASLEKLDARLIEAAFDPGANRRRALTRVILPLAVPGTSAACVLAFVPALGAYVSPELPGGGTAMRNGHLIQRQFGPARTGPLAAAAAFPLRALIL